MQDTSEIITLNNNQSKIQEIFNIRCIIQCETRVYIKSNNNPYTLLLNAYKQLLALLKINKYV